jgi:hypothetical protein
MTLTYQAVLNQIRKRESSFISSNTFPTPNHLPHTDIHTLLTEAEAKLAVADPGSAFTDVACDAGR